MPLSLWEWQTYGYGWLPDWASDVGPHLANGLVDSAILDLASIVRGGVGNSVG